MTTFADTVPTGREDPLYREGSDHLQRGEWQAAIDAFEQLQEKYPDSDLAARALEQAQLRSGVDTGRKVRGRRITLRFWPILLRLAVVALIGYLVYTGGRLLVERVQPMVRQAQLERERDQLLTEGQSFLEGGEYAAAEQRFNAVLAIEE